MLNYSRYIFSPKNITPIYLTYFVTSRCNLKCQHCFYWDSLNNIKNELSLEEIEKFSKTIGNLFVLSLTGGEPFLRKDLHNIVEIFHKNVKPKIVSIITNGYFTKDCIEITKKILDSCKGISLIIQLSLDGVEEDHNLIRMKNDSFKKALETFHALKELKSIHKNLNLGIITTITNFNQYKLPELMIFVKNELDPDYLTIPLTRGNPKNKLCKDVDIEQYKKVIQIKNKLFKNGYNNFTLSSLKNANENIIEKIVYRTAKYNKFQTSCNAAYLNAVISPNGDVLGCEILNNKIGNIRDVNYDFRKLWFTKQREQLSSLIKKNKCFCTHECNISVNTLFNIKYYPELILNTIKNILK